MNITECKLCERHKGHAMDYATVNESEFFEVKAGFELGGSCETWINGAKSKPFISCEMPSLQDSFSWYFEPGLWILFIQVIALKYIDESLDATLKPIKKP